jgi:hypothetical protein
MKMNASEIQNGLAGFYGTDGYHRLTIFGGLVATDGVAWLAKNAECYWLMDEIGIAQTLPQIRRNQDLQDMQFWTLTVKDSVGTLTCDDGNGHIALQKRISFTDFPLPEIKIWVEGKVMLLPSEH